MLSSFKKFTGKATSSAAAPSSSPSATPSVATTQASTPSNSSSQESGSKSSNVEAAAVRHGDAVKPWLNCGLGLVSSGNKQLDDIIGSRNFVLYVLVEQMLLMFDCWRW
jgi:hypothetical protein